MTRNEFVNAIIGAGWVSRSDAQHENINALWAKLFPAERTIELLHHEIELLNYGNKRLLEREEKWHKNTEKGSKYP